MFNDEEMAYTFGGVRATVSAHNGGVTPFRDNNGQPRVAGSLHVVLDDDYRFFRSLYREVFVNYAIARGLQENYGYTRFKVYAEFDVDLFDGKE